MTEKLRHFRIEPLRTMDSPTTSPRFTLISPRGARRHSTIEEAFDDEETEEIHAIPSRVDDTKHSSNIDEKRGDGESGSVKIFIRSSRDIATCKTANAHFDLAEGMPLNTFRKDACVKVPKALLLQSPYFKEKLKRRKSEAEMITIELKSIKMVDSYLNVLHALARDVVVRRNSLDDDDNDGGDEEEKECPHYRHHFDDKLSVQNQFQMFATASIFKLPGLKTRCADFIMENLSPQLFPTAVKFAMDHDDPTLRRVVYAWLRRLGPLRSLLRTDGTTRTGAASSTSSSSSSSPLSKWRRRKSAPKVATAPNNSTFRGDPVQQVDECFVDANMSSVVYINTVTPLLLFKDVVDAETKRCAKFSRVGQFTAKADDLKLEDFLEMERKMRASNDRNGFVGTEQFELRRTRNKSVVLRNGLSATCAQFDLYRCADGAYVMSARIYDGDDKILLNAKTDGHFDMYGEDFVGVVTSNFSGTVFNVYDNGMTLPGEFRETCGDFVRREICTVVYERNVLGRVPNTMRILHPRVDAKILPGASVRATFLDKVSRRFVHECKTRKPIWSEGMEAWTMDFRGRVKIASKKNMQIVCDDCATDEFGPRVILLFGKKTKDVFSLDFGKPFSALSAMGSVLPSFAKKLAVT
eukprot:g2936.t1